MEVCASVDGFVLHELTKGTSVTFGSRIAYVVDAIDAHGSAPPLPAGASQQAKAPLKAARAAASTPPAGGRQPKIIVGFGHSDDIVKCLNAIATQRRCPQFEVFIC